MLKNKYLIPGILLIVAFGLFFKVLSSKKKVTEKTEKNQVVVDSDKSDKGALEDFLNGDKIPENEIYGAVIRLGQVGDNTALEVAKKLVANESRLLREGAAQALSYFPDQNILKEVDVLLKDKEESVRVFAIEGLSVLKSQEREKMAEEKQKQSDLSTNEKVAVLGSLYKLRSQNEKQKKDLENLLGLAVGSDKTLSQKASLKAMQIAFEAKPVKEMMIEKVKNSKDETVKTVAIRNLANANDPWLREKLLELSQNPNPAIKIAAIQSLHRVCPENRWQIIENIIKKEKEESIVNHALEELLFIERAKSLMLLTKLSKDKDISPVRLKTLESYAAEITKKQDVSVCK